MKVPVVVALVKTPVEAVVAPMGVLLIEPAWRLPVPVALVKVKPARALTPEIFKLAPCKYPEAVRLVPEPLVKFRVGNKP